MPNFITGASARVNTSTGTFALMGRMPARFSSNSEERKLERQAGSGQAHNLTSLRVTKATSIGACSYEALPLCQCPPTHTTPRPVHGQQTVWHGPAVVSRGSGKHPGLATMTYVERVEGGPLSRPPSVRDAMGAGLSPLTVPDACDGGKHTDMATATGRLSCRHMAAIWKGVQQKGFASYLPALPHGSRRWLRRCVGLRAAPSRYQLIDQLEWQRRRVFGPESPPLQRQSASERLPCNVGLATTVSRVARFGEPTLKVTPAALPRAAMHGSAD